MRFYDRIIWVRSRRWVGFLFSVLGPFIGLAARFALGHVLAGIPFITFFPVAGVATVLGGRLGGLIASVISAYLAVRYLSPSMGFYLTWPDGWFTLLVFLVICMMLITLIDHAFGVSARLIAVTQELQMANQQLSAQVLERTADRDRVWTLTKDLMVVLHTGGEMTTVNPAWTDLLGWPESELLGRHIFSFIHPEDSTQARAAAAMVASGSTVLSFECRFLHRQGGFRWLSWTAVPGGGMINAVGRDVTADKLKSEALAQSEARMRAVFEMSFQLHALLSPEGRVQDANATALAAFGATLDDVLDKPLWDVPWFSQTPGLAAQLRQIVAAVAAGQIIRREVSVKVPAGWRCYMFSMRPVRDQDGAVIGIVPEAVDITERRQAEDALRQAQKMEAVGQLTGGLAHDFNNLLTGISGSLELLDTRIAQGDPEELDRYIKVAQGAARRAASLTHRLLAFSRRQTLDPRPVNANRLVADMDELIRRTAGPAVIVEAVAGPDLWNSLADPNQLESALLNLCINARDAMPDGGRLTIETANRWLDAQAARDRDLPPGQYVSLCVGDTGTGMSADVAARAFDPFFTTKPIGEGTGLGLSMVYGFARQSGGQVRIKSRIGAGTTVCLFLPRHAGEAETAAAVPAAAAPPRAGPGETILLVDDEPTVRILVGEVLDRLGYQVLEAQDGPSALKFLDSNRRIDLLVTDVGLPGGLNGRQLADAAVVLRPALQTLFITGYAEAAVLGEGQLKPGMQLMTKPFTMEALAGRIKKILVKEAVLF